MIDFNSEGSTCHISGRLSQQEVVRLWESRECLVNKGVKVIDLSGLTYSDSAGIAFILELFALAKKEGRELTLAAASSQLSKLIALYNLELFFTQRSNTR